MPPSTKRVKLSPPKEDTLKDIIDVQHREFTAWAIKRGVEINKVLPKRLPGRGLGLITTAPIAQDERILFVPEKAMLKPDAALMKRSGLDRASPQAKLAASAMVKCRADNAPFAVWERTWPTTVDFEQSLPLCWPAELCENLPASVRAPLARQRADYAKDWHAVRKLCEDKGWPEADFKYYWMIVNSRSFHWKPPYGRAGSMVMCPFIDYLNHGPTGTSCNITQSPEGYEVTAQRDYAAGEEVLATYGSHPNEKLLVHYGFLNASTRTHPSIDDEIRLDDILLTHIQDSVKSQLLDTGFLGSYALVPTRARDDDENDHSSPSTKEAGPHGWEPCFKTQVAVRACLLTSNEWEYFVTNGEDLSGDKTASVRRWLSPILKAYRDEAALKAGESKIVMPEAIDRDAFIAAVGLIRARWAQIRDAVDGFLES